MRNWGQTFILDNGCCGGIGRQLPNATALGKLPNEMIMLLLNLISRSWNRISGLGPIWLPFIPSGKGSVD